mmetsp:Transcript_6177/g.9983  ORF Transcript_6177/g.9983 Transcript_6177/m.9983 type:complete len:98 (-) Transcript_6177:819-1112(-)
MEMSARRTVTKNQKQLKPLVSPYKKNTRPLKDLAPVSMKKMLERRKLELNGKGVERVKIIKRKPDDHPLMISTYGNDDKSKSIFSNERVNVSIMQES